MAVLGVLVSLYRYYSLEQVSILLPFFALPRLLAYPPYSMNEFHIWISGLSHGQ